MIERILKRPHSEPLADGGLGVNRHGGMNAVADGVRLVWCHGESVGTPRG
jgi:hypothetical protein